MKLSYQLHRTGAESDWHDVQDDKKNSWQKIAQASKGWLTPANAITIAGAFFSLAGLIYMSYEVTLHAITLLVFGRLLDVVDGHVAELTSTKSPLGELLDATIDKIVAVIALIVFAVFSLLPIAVIVVLAIQNIVNILVSSAARIKRIELHPTLNGKFAAFFIWSTVILFLYEKTLSYSNHLVNNLAWLSLGGFVIFGGISSYQYVIQYLNNRTQNAQ